VIHELRNPLVGIDAAARVLARELASHPVGPRAAAIAAEARHLLELLESLADVESIESGRLRSVLRPIDLAALVRETALAMHIGDHPVALRGGDVAIAVRADDRRIRQVIKNLLANAAQYSPVGTTIEVTVGIGARRRAATVEVRDHGPGIPPLERRKLFRKFARLSTAEGTRGSGLGLYICRRIVADHGGELRAGRPSGGGSAFSFTLPLAEGSVMRSSAERRPARSRNRSAASVPALPSPMRSRSRTRRSPGPHPQLTAEGETADPRQRRRSPPNAGMRQESRPTRGNVAGRPAEDK